MLPGFLIRLFRSAIFMTLMLGVIFSLIIYFLGPFLGYGDWYPLETLPSRLIVIGVIWSLILLFLLVRFLLRRRREKKMAEEIVEAEKSDPEEDYIKAEVSELGSKLKEALTLLRKSKLGRRSLYELPWYIMIGPPGAGKTTAISNSGMNFPLARSEGTLAVRGVGGTRNCDWWFTDSAVMIDTAGRYTVQESGGGAESGAWLGFLDLLRKYRPRQPVNGAIVAISLSDLSQQDRTTQMEHARAIRRRLNELRERLGLRFPVYVVFTKADLVAGFTEFFDTLGREERAQVWGHTFDLKRQRDRDADEDVERYDESFSGLLAQLNAQVLDRMQDEADPQRRALISGFPNQFATLRILARDFLNEMFQANRYEDRHTLRGYYFTSGTQEGTPIDRLMMSMARTFGIGRQAIGTGRGTGRSFFLRRLFEDVVYKESGLVSFDDKVERRFRIVKYTAIAASTIIAVALAGVWTRSYLANTDMIAAVSDLGRTYQEAAADIERNPVSDDDVATTVPTLNLLRDAPLNDLMRDPDVPPNTGWGLYQGDVLGTELAQTYRAGLNLHFLPRLLIRLEDQMSESINSPGELYDALKIYMMMGNLGGDAMGNDFVRDWFLRDWESTFRGAARKPMRDDLVSHLDALLNQPLNPPELNGDLIERVQSTLAEMPLERRVYSGILKSPEATALQPWRLTDVGGGDLEKVIVRSSGKPLSEGIEGIFTYDGFNVVFLPKTLAVARQVQIENWVLGRYGEQDISDNVLVLLARDVLDLYYNDYVERYATVLDEIDVVPLENAQHAVDVTFTLSGATSPIEKIFEAISAETKLTDDRSLLQTDGLSTDASDLARAEARSTLDFRSRFILEQIIQLDSEEGREEKPPGYFVEERFEWLHRLLSPPQEGQPSRLDGIIAQIREANEELTRLLTTDPTLTNTAPAGESAIRRLQVQVASLDGPLKRWAGQIAAGSSGITTAGVRGALNATWQGRVLGQCNDVVDKRFPFSPRSSSDAPLAAFTSLFGPSGEIETFFKENLLRYVDTRSRPWTWKAGTGSELGISAEVLRHFEYADQIKRAFFANGVTPSVAFQIQPYAAGDKVQGALLHVDGSEITYAKGQGSAPLPLRWPGPVGSASIAFEPRDISRENSISRDGPWAFFRLLRTAQIRRVAGSDQLGVTFEVGGRFAVFRIRADAILDPLTLPALTKFSCPRSL